MVMAYEKRLCVLKQIKRGFSADGSPLSGAVHAERLGGELTLTVKLLGVAPVREGRYALVVWLDGKYFYFALSDNGPIKLENAPTLHDGFSALILFVKGEAEPIAYGHCGFAPADYQPLLRAFEEEGVKKKRKQPIPTPLSPNQVPGIPSPQVPLAPGVPVPDEGEKEAERAIYDDEAIADANYFTEKENDGKADQNENAARRGGGKKEKGTHAGGAASHEEDGVEHPFYRGGGLTYYNSVREKIKEAFAKFPRAEELSKAISQSEWIKANGAYLGIVYEKGQPRYLCVASESHGEPPEEMKETCVFVPANPFTETEGYYVVFQDADTGEIVKTAQS